MLTFNYDTSSRVNKVTEPDGVHFTTYAYDANNNLTTVTGPDGKVRRYHYENEAYPNALTGITDEQSQRTAYFAYDLKGRAISSKGANGARATSVAYLSNGKNIVTTPSGAVRTYTLTTQFNTIKPTAITGAPCNDCGGVGFSYDANGFISSRTDSNGNVTNYVHNAAGLETSRTEAFGTAQGRTIATTWHGGFRLPLTITEPNRTTTFTYDTSGNLLTRTITAGSKTRTWTYTYNTLGQVLTVNGPRTDVSDVTTYAYYPNNGTDPYGMLASVTNAAGHVSNYTVYDANGRLKNATDPNGTVTAMTYDLRGRLLTRTTGGLQTTYQYSFAGDMTRLTRPDGSYADFTYDGAHRVTRVADNLGNRIDYRLDADGQVVEETARNVLDLVTQRKRAEYDTLNRLKKSLGASGQTTQYSYDNNGNLTGVSDPLFHVTTMSYDALDRQITSQDPLLGAAGYGYDANDNLTAVVDPRSQQTGYGMDALGNRTSVSSPDSGVTLYQHDDAGNVTQSTDAAGRVQGFAYDALNRVVQMTATGLPNTVLSYDGGTYGKGRLTGMTDMAGSTGWTWDALGRLTNKTQTVVGGVARSTGYVYNAQGQLSSMTYPSGKIVSYTYNANGQVSGIKLNGVNLLTGITYQPFGGPNGWLWGNGTAYSRVHDADGRVAGYTLGATTNRTLSYDAASRITGYSETGGFSQVFGYDANDRLISWDRNGAFAASWSYDADGNRLSEQAAGQTLASYAYPTGNNQLSGVTGGSLPLTASYDATGNITAIGGGQSLSFVYDGRNRLAQTTNSGITTDYWINGLGQRLRKTYNGPPSSSITFIYDESRKLIGEYNLAGVLVAETIYLGDLPVATLVGASTYYIYADHTNTPRVITGTNNTPVWTWDAAPFGNTMPVQNPIIWRSRAPGQYYDAEHGGYHNGFRDYYPPIGRYLQSDPIGLAAGMNT